MYYQTIVRNIHPNSQSHWRIPIHLLLVLAITCLTAPHQVRAADGGVGDGTSTAEGNNALSMLSTGTDNTGLGFNALAKNTTGGDNTAVGSNALSSNISGVANTAIGAFALPSGNDNNAIGFLALSSNTTGHENTADGPAALESNTTGFNNTATGEGALEGNTTGNNNTADGMTALLQLTSGNNNIALGYRAGINLTAGGNDIYIGNPGKSAESNTVRIGTQGTQKSTFIAGIAGTTVTGAPVLVTTAGKLGIMSSSARFKEQIKPMDKSSEAVLALKPVTFRYKEELDPEKIPQFGLIAEEVEKVNPDLIVRDEEGKVTTVRYEAVNAMLLNEFLKEHHKVEELEKQIKALTAGLQKVTARVDAASSGSHVVGDN